MGLEQCNTPNLSTAVPKKKEKLNEKSRHITMCMHIEEQ